MNFLSRRNNKESRETQTRRVAREELDRRKRDDDDDTGIDEIDNLADEVADLTQTIKDEFAPKKRDGGDGILGGSFGQIFELMNSINLQGGLQFAIDRTTFVERGPLDPLIPTPPTPIGGANYDPAAGANPTSATNARILKWAVNGVVFNARALLAFAIYYAVMLKWHVLEMLLDDDGESADGSDLEDLLVFSMLFSALGQQSPGSTNGILGGFGTLFGMTGNNAPLLNTAQFYPVV